MSRKGTASSKRHQATMEKNRVSRESVRSKFANKNPKPDQKNFTGLEELAYKKNYTYTITYTPSADEAAWLASDQDFEKGNKGIYVFVGLQAAAAASLTAYGWYAKDPGSLITGGANVVRNCLWLGAHMTVKHVPDLRVSFHKAAAGTVSTANRALEKFDFIKDRTKSVRKSFRRTRRNILADAKAIREPLAEKYESQIYRDKVHATINAFGAASGVLVHFGQILYTDEALVKIGASVAAGAYALMAWDQGVEASRWSKLYKSVKNKKDFKYNHEEAHMLVGYAANGEYINDATLKWTPPVLLTGKGGLYGAESVVLAQQAASTGSVVALAASGIIFAASAGYEFVEQNGSKIKYLYNRYVRNEQEPREKPANDIFKPAYTMQNDPSHHFEIEIKSEPDDIEHGPS